MRKLNKEEKELTQRGIERNREALKELKFNQEYNKQQRKFQEQTWKWEEYSKPIKRELLISEYDKTEKKIELEIKEKEEGIKEMEKHLKQGVTEKVLLGVQ